MSTIRIPILDLTPEIEALSSEFEAAFRDVMWSTRFILGPHVKSFEANVAAFLQTPWALGVNSGTDGLFIALEALGVGPGDEVITTPFSFFATSEAIGRVGAIPIFADIDPDTFNIDPASLQAKITPKTRAIIPVHLYGHAADMDPILDIAKQHDLAVLEDVAQAFGGLYKGTPLGTLGHAGAFSFFPSKNLGAFGDAGLIVGRDENVEQECRKLRAHGSLKKYHNTTLGYNSRLDELQGAILNVKLPHIDRQNQGRRRVAHRYTEHFTDHPDIQPPVEQDYAHHVYHQYTIKVPADRRDALKSGLAEAGIGTMIYYPIPLHKLPVYDGLEVDLPVADELSHQVLSLPIWPQMTDETQDEVIEAVKRIL